MKLIALSLVLAFGLAAASCSLGDDLDADLEAARESDELPLYWVGEEFEGLDITHVEGALSGRGGTFVYGTCEITGDHGCAPPLAIQIFPLCFHLDVATANDRWERRTIRGSPVGKLDWAPLMFTERTQIKVYRGQGSNPGMALRALRKLRSLNDVAPRIGPVGPIPPPARGVLEGTVPCSA